MYLHCFRQFLSDDFYICKIGIEGVNSNLATAIRTIVILVMAWGIVFLTGAQGGVSEISGKKLAIPDFVGTSNRCFMALLL